MSPVPDVAERLTRCFLAVFPELKTEEASRASMVSLASWDSLATINLIAVIEDTFEIQVAAEALESMVSFELILDYLEGRVGDTGS
ncbi:MAG: acyl carrier protein [Gemmatimonadales bacterium]